MRPARLPAVMLLAVAGGCMPVVRGTVARHDPLAQQLIALAAARIQRCYSMPRLGHAARQIETKLSVRYAPDGSLAAVPELVAQRGVTDANRADAGRVAEAAVAAVIRCTPLNLPPEHYRDGWDMFELSFSPKAVA